MEMKLGHSEEGVWIGGIWEQSADVDIWTWERWSSNKLEKMISKAIVFT
jgi:hypothetical protein